MRENFNLDRLIDYSIEPISDPVAIVNPRYRALDGQIRSLAAKLSRRLAKFGAMNLKGDIEAARVEQFVENKATLQEEIETFQTELGQLKHARKEVPHHITLAELPKNEQFDQLGTQSKHLVDTIKMIAYRAETALANLLREHLSHPDEARRMLQTLFITEADLLPDYDQGTLTVRLHHLANRRSDNAIQKLCDELNATETCFPATKLRLVLKLES